jgi:HNH endonuclease
MTRVPKRIREQVRQRANGRCEYCHKPEGVTTFSHQVDHIIPEKHLGSPRDLINLAWACFRCNNAKTSEISSYDELNNQLTPLYNPRTQQWDDHFEMQHDGAIVAKTPIGRVTVRILQMNKPRRVDMRRMLMEAGLM